LHLCLVPYTSLFRSSPRDGRALPASHPCYERAPPRLTRVPKKSSSEADDVELDRPLHHSTSVPAHPSPPDQAVTHGFTVPVSGRNARPPSGVVALSDGFLGRGGDEKRRVTRLRHFGTPRAGASHGAAE